MPKRILKYKQSFQNALILFFMACSPIYLFFNSMRIDTGKIKKAKKDAESIASKLHEEFTPISFDDLLIKYSKELNDSSLLDKIIELDSQDNFITTVKSLSNIFVFIITLHYGNYIVNNSEVLNKINSENRYNIRLLSYNGFLCEPDLVLNYFNNGFYEPNNDSNFDEKIYNDNLILQDYDRCVEVYDEMAKIAYNNYYSEIDYYYKSCAFQGAEIKDAINGKTGIKIRKELKDDNNQMIYIAVPCKLIDTVVPDYILLLSVKHYKLATKDNLIGNLILTGFIMIISIMYTLIIHFRIYKPILQLSQETYESLDKNGNVIKTDFKALKHDDELGDISQAFATVIKRLDKRQKYIEVYSSDVVHEFKNPLAAIRSSVDIMNDPDLKSEDKQKLYKSINEEIHHLEVLLNDIRNISKIENQNDEEGKENVPVGLFTENILKRIKTNYDTVTFNFNCKNQNKVYFIKPENLDRMLENLIDNAASFAVKSKQKKVSVSIESIIEKDGKETMTIAVEDSGTGVPAGEEEKIFERFYTHREDEQKKDHSGLGLSTVKAIVDSMNGKIAVGKSEELGGAKFLIELP